MDRDKIRKYVKIYSTELSEGPQRTLYCYICNTNVDFSKKFNVESHRKRKAHIVSAKQKPMQPFCGHGC